MCTVQLLVWHGSFAKQNSEQKVKIKFNGMMVVLTCSDTIAPSPAVKRPRILKEAYRLDHATLRSHASGAMRRCGVVFRRHHLLVIVIFGTWDSSACGHCRPWAEPRSTCARSLCRFARPPSGRHGCCNSSSDALVGRRAFWAWIRLGTSGHSRGTRTTLNILC